MNVLNCKGRLLNLEVPAVMGILNVTPDSFYDGGQFNVIENALEQTGQMLEEGATIIDIGGMSSRPGAEIISVDEELNRVLLIVREIHKSFPKAILSIDTVHSDVAQKTIDEGVSMINDISGGTIDPGIWDVAKVNDVPYVLMHMQGRPNDMQKNPTYDDVALDILKFLRDKVFNLENLGVKDILIDPGFGFGKSIDQNYQLLNRLGSFRILDCPILVGISRKSMIYKLLDSTPEEALNGTSALHMIALQNGAKILRTHDVREAVECVQLHEQLKKTK